MKSKAEIRSHSFLNKKKKKRQPESVISDSVTRVSPSRLCSAIKIRKNLKTTHENDYNFASGQF